jgi:phage shock protein C
MDRKLYRSRSDSILAGVCGGLGQYLGIDPNLVRIAFILFTVFSGVGTLIYFLLWILVPREGQTGYENEPFQSRAHQFRDDVVNLAQGPNPKAISWIGIALLTAGLVFLVQALNLSFLQWLNGTVIWAAVLIVGGGALIYRALKKG